MKMKLHLPDVKINHIFHMTDDTGMFQHSIYGVPNLSKGYTADDNARALIMAVMLYEHHHTVKVENLIYRYTSFLNYAQNEDGTFRNFMEYNRVFLEKKGSEDCHGRCLWALCFAYSHMATPENVRKNLWKMIEKAIPHCTNLISPRAKAYSVIGLSFLDSEEGNRYISILASTLAELYEQHNDTDWHWFENNMTYCNSILPWSMLCAYKATKEERYQEICLESLEFLETKTFRDEYFKPIGCNGWLQRGMEPAESDEQPVEAAETALTYLSVYSLTGKDQYLDRARTAFLWYTGQNSKSLSLIDPETGGCYDGIEYDGLNHNQGAESVVSFWIAYLEIQKYV